MTLEQAGAAVAARAVRIMEEDGADLSIWTETGNKNVLVGIARRGKAATTMLIPRAEYDGMALLEMLELEHG